MDGEFVSEGTPLVNKELEDGEGHAIFYESEEKQPYKQGVISSKIKLNQKNKAKLDSRDSFMTEISNVPKGILDEQDRPQSVNLGQNFQRQMT